MRPGAALAGLTAVALLSLAGPARAQQPGPLGLERTFANSPSDDTPSKPATAYCSPGKRVVGGGAAIAEGGGHHVVRLVWLVPQHPGGSLRDSFTARAESPSLLRGFDWRLTAYAICINQSATSSAYRIVPGLTAGPDAFKTAAARCPGGTVALGAGAAIHAGADRTGQGVIGLQLNRTSRPLDISRAAARISLSSYGAWALVSYAICDRPAGAIHVESSPVPGPGTAEATHFCASPGDWVRGIGGGGGLRDNGQAFLRELSPSFDLKGVTVKMTAAPVGGTLAYHTCASGH
jgi:hypothetical protein